MDWRLFNGALGVLRLVVGSVCFTFFFTGDLVAGIYGVSEIFAATMTIQNSIVAREGDMTWRGLAVVACYFAGAVFVPGGGATIWFLVGVQMWFVALRLWGQWTMGACYSILPTWRRLVDRGPFAFVRHPLALAAVGMRWCVVASNPTAFNLSSGFLFTVAAVLSVKLEERFLVEGQVWRDYASRVRWRMLPGVY